MRVFFLFFFSPSSGFLAVLFFADFAAVSLLAGALEAVVEAGAFPAVDAG